MTFSISPPKGMEAQGWTGGFATLAEAVHGAFRQQAGQEKKSMVEVRRGEELVAKVLDSGSVLVKESMVAEVFGASA